MYCHVCCCMPLLCVDWCDIEWPSWLWILYCNCTNVCGAMFHVLLYHVVVFVLSVFDRVWICLYGYLCMCDLRLCLPLCGRLIVGDALCRYHPCTCDCDCVCDRGVGATNILAMAHPHVRRIDNTSLPRNTHHQCVNVIYFVLRHDPNLWLGASKDKLCIWCICCFNYV